ncbi:amino acid/amide ABC transporter substrate-binding protein, HAAT family [Chitinophaga jiangningensis]|uniref:Amino acid/amide ABC transporter substrate-binding protein, HAAT family n=1 Tax=Chitinophaga jiangningensis TaxID=1419482 RepID=A0A1M7J0L6_9BACT|nr:ABC transporter substrate-binding protein [Chitinophaga jiangningensis]SHM46453.1 amino acid/amide ABC transporter substrate-binding protein, HAAT family [Chitinophaga jiangningensis]
MQAALSIGFLTPYSGVYPAYSAHLVTGWLLGMGLDPVRQRTVQFTSEYTHMGSARASADAARKLLFFNNVDVLSGLISYKVTPDIIPLVEQSKKPAFFFDMGEYIPHFPHLSPDMFYASHQLWQSQFALGNWAHKQFGDGGHMIMPVYEAGYHLHTAFREGVTAAGSTQIGLTVLPFDQNDPSKMELDELFVTLARDAPSYVHAIFAGSMGTRFLQKWIESGFHKKIPLVINETMAYDDILQDIKHIDLEIYTSMTWMREDQRKANQLFVKKFESIAQQPANVYALMGYEAGLMWRELLPYAQQKDWSAVKQQLRTGVIDGPRGEKNFYPASGFALPTVNILRISTTGNKINKLILDQGTGMRYDAKEFEMIHNESLTGWQNPFLCI